MIFGNEVKFSLFADDTNIVCADLASVERALKLVEEFGKTAGLCIITITFIWMTIIIYSIAKSTLKQEQQEKEIIIMILITDNQVTSFLDDRILSRKLFNNEI